MSNMTPDRIRAAYSQVRDLLLEQRICAGHWEGELSSSALSTATAVMALQQVLHHRYERQNELAPTKFSRLISDGLRWIAAEQNEDGGWGDTTLSVSNISTSMLCHAVFHATGTCEQYASTVKAGASYIEQQGGVSAVRRRYGKDKTFSVPILTHCALAGLVDWNEISPLPFELSCVPHRFYKWLSLPVVSYALPALIAIGQCHFYQKRPWNPAIRFLRNSAREPSLRVLERIQPTTGGFLEATPLTSFVTMSLANAGRASHPVVDRGVEFLVASVRQDGSWPIDTNLATWVTTLSINALGSDVPVEIRPILLKWLGNQQYREIHPYTQADPGGWAWTNLSGGVPDADDTPGAILAILNLLTEEQIRQQFENEASGTGGNEISLTCALTWLINLQNRDGGFPTFCKGWGALPFDRSAPDITAHCLRALALCQPAIVQFAGLQRLSRTIKSSIRQGFAYLKRKQRNDGSWLPLWFGNQHHAADENATYGTAKVVLAYEQTRQTATPEYLAGIDWLIAAQNGDGSWSGVRGLPPSIEESALALDALMGTIKCGSGGLSDSHRQAVDAGLSWLIDQIERGQVHQYSPIGFYFAKLWYFEKLYPISFATQTMRRAVECFVD